MKIYINLCILEIEREVKMNIYFSKTMPQTWIDQADNILKFSENFSKSLVQTAIRVKQNESINKGNNGLFIIDGGKSECR